MQYYTGITVSFMVESWYIGSIRGDLVPQYIVKNRAKSGLYFSRNSLKIIAIAAMFFDHFIAVFMNHGTILGQMLRFPGRIAAPIMCYFIAEGYHHTSCRKKYLLRLLVFAVISHLPYNLCFGYTFFQATSIIWGLAMGLVALIAVMSDKVHFAYKLIIVAMCCALSITANWNYVAVLWIVIFGLYHGNIRRQVLGFCLVGIIFHLIPTYLDSAYGREETLNWYQLGIFSAIPLIAMYNGERGTKSKAITWFYYVFYPTHLLLLFLLDKYTLLSHLFR